MGRGAQREGKELEKGGLMQQDTDGDVEMIRTSQTNGKDEGIDFIKIIKSGFNYIGYNNRLKIKKRRRNSR